MLCCAVLCCCVMYARLCYVCYATYALLSFREKLYTGFACFTWLDTVTWPGNGIARCSLGSLRYLHTFTAMCTARKPKTKDFHFSPHHTTPHHTTTTQHNFLVPIFRPYLYSSPVSLSTAISLIRATATAKARISPGCRDMGHSLSWS